jgi:hypothetical protein
MRKLKKDLNAVCRRRDGPFTLREKKTGGGEAVAVCGLDGEGGWECCVAVSGGRRLTLLCGRMAWVTLAVCGRAAIVWREGGKEVFRVRE